MIPESMAAMTAMPTVPMIHFCFLSSVVIYGLRSSVPGMIQALVWPTHYSSIRKRSIRFMMDRITKLCQKPDQKPRAPLIAYTHTST